MSVTTTDTLCPAACLAREAAEVHATADKADAAGRHEAADHLYERRQAIEAQASFVRASSPLGAFFQALLLFGEADDQSTYFHECLEPKKTAHRIQRLVASIAGHLEGSADRATVEALRDIYLSRDNERSKLGAPFIAAAA